MLKRALICAVLGAVLLAMTATPALAGGGEGAVQCQGQGCTLTAQDDGSPAGTGTAAHLGGPGAGSNSGCFTDAATIACPLPIPRPGGPSAGGLPVSPAVLAQTAVKHLALQSPLIEASPPVGVDQLVNVPTWLWLAGSWTSVHATAAVPGVSVTATAVPQLVTWRMGDGSVVVCHGPGTPFASGDNPAAPSQTCGHTYRESSASAPGGVFTVSATITWNVTWAGGGGNGAFGGLTTTAAVQMPVAESQAIVTGTAP
jgi:hypothetical protein